MAKKKVFSIGSSLSQGLEETIAAAHNYSGELRIDVIPIRKIETDPENPRHLVIALQDIYQGINEYDPLFHQKNRELESLQSLANSIKGQGLINPVVVYKHNDAYRLVAGERRTLASALANKLDIQAKILDGKPDELKVRILQWIENIERTDLSLWERLSNLEKIIEAFAKQKNLMTSDITVTDISQLIGCAKSHAVNLKAVLNTDETLKNLIQLNKIKNLEKAALIASIQSKEIKQQAIEACISGTTLKNLKLIAAQENIKPRKKKQEKRGRQATTINFGTTTNIEVAKVILTSIFNNVSLSHVVSPFKEIDLSDTRSITELFKQLIKKLEELKA